jgi:hypothetical protein
LWRTQPPTPRRASAARPIRTRREHTRRARTGSIWPFAARLAAALALLGVLVLGAVKLGVPAASALAAAWTDWRTPDPVAMPVAVPGTRTVKQPVVEVVLFDSSSSMEKNDPDNQRDAALRAYGRWLERYGRASDRFGVVRFFDDATSVPGLLKAGALAQGVDVLAPLPSGGATNLMPAVERAEAILRDAPHGSRRTALIITDGEVADDARAGIARLRKVTDHIEVVALDRDDTWDSAKSRWKAPGVRLTEARNRRPNELGAELAQSFLRTTGEKAK